MKLDIISGFLGAGKTTFLNKLLPNLGEQAVIIENEYGDVAVDGSLIEDELPIKEIMAGCICCSLVLDFKSAIKELAAKYHPQRIIIEPSGVSCLSDVLKACAAVADEVEGGLEIDRLITIVDASGFADYIEDFGAFYGNQIENANIIFLSHLENLDGDVDSVVEGIRKLNPHACIWAEDWFNTDGEMLCAWLTALADSQTLYRPSAEQGRVIFNAHDVFGSWSVQSDRIWQDEEIERLLQTLAEGECGRILRAKGILRHESGKAVNFNFTPHNSEHHIVSSSECGRAAVIGCRLDEEKLAKLFD